MEQVKNILPTVLADLKEKRVRQKDSVETIWGKTLGEKQRKHARVVSLRAGKLKVFIDSSAWLYQFNLDKEKIFAKLKKNLKNPDSVKEIVFRMGQVK